MCGFISIGNLSKSDGTIRRYVMSQSSQKRNVIWLHQMNFVIVGNAWVCHTPIVCFGDDIICKRDIYVSIRERCSRNM